MPKLNLSVFARACVVAVVAMSICSPDVYGQTTADSPSAARATPEQRAARALEAARANPLELRAFLVRMPKGADLHYHLSGGI